MMMTYEEMWKI